MENAYMLKLYIIAQPLKAERIIKSLRELFKNEFENKHSLEIIDVVENPELVEQDKFLATPALVDFYPLPRRRIIGDLFNKERILDLPYSIK